MLKFGLLIVLVGLAAAVESDEFKWDTVPPAGNSSQCIYKPETRQLGCRGMSGIVQCEVMGELPKGFEVFGMGREELEGDSPIESIRYFLYPRELNETEYENHIIQVENVAHNVSLYHLESMTETVGLRVPDVKCWSRFIDLFKASTGIQIVKVEDMTTEVSLFGEILVVDKQAQKRWLGWGLGWGGLGLWGWGLGWGLNPFLWG
ncbi:unnamed protein product [Brachionus calyciflorus]|uniref:Uncharacterized protein n=1 Tax=Brachionus calyciflorus TaxID=104777 RepID=A0A813WKE6_9BILA|nr:unnamed protein product [Brachionus calyciflorus]